MPPSKPMKRKPLATPTKKNPDGSQQYVRGNNASDRVNNGAKAVRIPQASSRAKELLLKATVAQLGPKERANYEAMRAKLNIKP